MTDPCCATPDPEDRANPAGLGALRYRTGTWSSFREEMLAQLSRQPHSPEVQAAGAPRPLAALTTREPTDDTIGLIDAWACVCDVLTFYGERIINEGYLNTATEARSVTEIARGIGYRPDPGVSALTALAFTIDETVEEEVTVPLGQPVLSVPGPDELPQTFETSDELLARSAWNVLRPKRTVAHPIVKGTDTLYLETVSTGLRIGDPIVVLGSTREQDSGALITERWDLRFVTAIETFADGDTYADAPHTVVTLQDGLGDDRTNPASDEVQVFTMGARAGLFGWNAPDARMMSAEVKKDVNLISGDPPQWKNFSTLESDSTRTSSIGPEVIDLDLEYPGIVAGSWICLHEPTEVELFRVTKTNPASRTEFSLSGRVTRVFLDGDENLDRFRRRSTTVLCESRELPIAEKPATDPIDGFEVELDGIHPPMSPGRAVIITGQLLSTGETTVIETTVGGWSESATHSTVTITTDLPAMERATVEVYGNVVSSTHGAKVVDEILGHGDAGLANQQMLLRHAPLTWTPGAPTGAKSSLEIEVAGVLWTQVDTFFDRGPTDRVFTAKRLVTDELDSSPRDLSKDVSVVTFGDGRRGARLPTGFDNVIASYRTGLGEAGNLEAEQLTLLQQRPAAVRGVHNPSMAIGGSDPADLDQIRQLAPLNALTLGRLVSLQDYEDHAGTFSGVGKARAVDLWDGHRSFVHVTIAGASGTMLDANSAIAIALVESVDALKDPGHRVVVAGHVPRQFTVKMRLRVAVGVSYSDTRDAVEAALLKEFSFDNRQFGQPVLLAEVMAVVHGVEHVVAVDVDVLNYTPSDGSPATGLNEVLAAAVARWDGTTATQAELLLLQAADITISPLEDS